MGDTTKIAWTEHTFNHAMLRAFQVDCSRNIFGTCVERIVTCFAQGDSVGVHKSRVRMRSEWQDMMCVQIPAPRIATVLACETIANVNIKSPALVFLSCAETESFRGFAISISGAIRASKGFLSDYFAYLRSCFDRVPLAEPFAWTTNVRRSHCLPSSF